jgi:hypothetical protein
LANFAKPENSGHKVNFQAQKIESRLRLPQEIFQ